MRTASASLLTWLHRLDSYSNVTVGRPVAACVAAEVCVVCGKPATTFASDAAGERYLLTGHCEPCQQRGIADTTPPMRALLFKPLRAAAPVLEEQS